MDVEQSQEMISSEEPQAAGAMKNLPGHCLLRQLLYLVHQGVHEEKHQREHL